MYIQFLIILNCKFDPYLEQIIFYANLVIHGYVLLHCAANEVVTLSHFLRKHLQQCLLI